MGRTKTLAFEPGKMVWVIQVVADESEGERDRYCGKLISHDAHTIELEVVAGAKLQRISLPRSHYRMSGALGRVSHGTIVSKVLEDEWKVGPDHGITPESVAHLPAVWRRGQIAKTRSWFLHKKSSEFAIGWDAVHTEILDRCSQTDLRSIITSERGHDLEVLDCALDHLKGPEGFELLRTYALNPENPMELRKSAYQYMFEFNDVPTDSMQADFLLTAPEDKAEHRHAHEECEWWASQVSGLSDDVLMRLIRESENRCIRQSAVSELKDPRRIGEFILGGGSTQIGDVLGQVRKIDDQEMLKRLVSMASRDVGREALKKITDSVFLTDFLIEQPEKTANFSPFEGRTYMDTELIAACLRNIPDLEPLVRYSMEKRYAPFLGLVWNEMSRREK